MNLCKNCYHNTGKPDKDGFHMCEMWENISSEYLKKMKECDYYQNKKIKLRIKVMALNKKHIAYYVQIKRWYGWKTFSVEHSRRNAEYICKEIRNYGPEYKI